MSQSDRIDVRTSDGRSSRSVEVHLAGVPDGRVVVFHHGTPGSGLPDPALVAELTQRGLRYVGISRPGYGGSSRQVGRTVASMAADVAAVLDHLDVGRCLTVGWSGGGPHTLATAIGLPERVDAAALLASVAPYDAAGLDFLAGMGQDNLDEFGLAIQSESVAGEPLLRDYLDQARAGLLATDGSGVIAEMASLLPQADRDVLTGAVVDALVASFHDGLQSSCDGWLDDDLAFVRPWGIDLAALAVPVAVWQGSADLMVPYAHGQWLAAHLPGAQVRLREGAGHLSITVGALGEILDDLLALTGAEVG